MPRAWSDLEKWADGHEKERLDRYVAPSLWRDVFKEATVFHRDFWGSDHQLLHLVLSSSERGHNAKKKKKKKKGLALDTNPGG